MATEREQEFSGSFVSRIYQAESLEAENSSGISCVAIGGRNHLLSFSERSRLIRQSTPDRHQIDACVFVCYRR